MTKAQIELILDEVGSYDLNQVIALKEVSSISLTTDGCLYPGDATRFNFSTANGNLLLVYNGYEDSEGVFHAESSLPSQYISFDAIEAFSLVSDKRIEMPYRWGRAV